MNQVRVLVCLDELPEGGDKAWDNLVERNQASGFMQSTSWAAFKRRRNYRIFHNVLMHGDELVGGAIGYAPAIGSAPAAGKGKSILCFPDGPLLPWHDPELAGEALRLLVQSTKQIAEDENLLAVRVEPRLSPPIPACFRMFKRAPVDSLPCETLYIDLGLSDSELLKSFHPKCRYNIRLAARHGVSVREELSGSAIADFYSIMTEAAQRDDFFVESFDFFQDLFSSLPPGMIRLFLAEHEGEYLGAAAVLTFGERATYLYGGVSNSKRNLMAGYALQWHIMCAVRAKGCSVYDFYGFVSPALSEHPHAQFSRFKQQFGGKKQRFIGANDYYFIDSLASLVIEALTEVS